MRHFEAKEENVGAARRFVGSALAGWGRVEQAEVAVLLTSEVVTNAVIHAGPHDPGSVIVVTVAWANEAVRVEVTDGHPGTLTVADGALAEISGRGLVLVAALSSGWGVVSAGADKMVWFEVQP